MGAANRDKMGQNQYYKSMEKMDKQIKVQESLRQVMNWIEYWFLNLK